MDLSTASIRDVIHPTAAFPPSDDEPDQWCALPVQPASTAEADSWSESQLNPKNRIDSLDTLHNPLWRIDGCTGMATQYYAIPLFLGSIPPMRFDVFVPEEASSCPLVRRLLDLNTACHTRDPERLGRLGIVRHILRTLQFWTMAEGEGGTAAMLDMYMTMPFGSRIIFENLDFDIRKIRITIAQTFYVERSLLNLGRIASCLGIDDHALPEAIDIFQLRIVQQLHDSVCVVHFNHPSAEAPQLWILKALTSGPKFLYTELRNLLSMEAHEHVISRPKYLVTKSCGFGGKRGVVGFIIPYHPRGSIRDMLPLLRIHGQLPLQAQLKWATQLASAVLHVRERGRIFYPDLRLDNIVLSDAGNVILVDFEQRGVWCEFAAPEVNALDYVHVLANDGVRDEDYDFEEGWRDRYAALLDRFLPDWRVLQDVENFVGLPHGCRSHNIAWECLSPREQEAAEVYMLGRVLWCIFEGQSGPQRASFWQSYRREPEYEFPEFRRAPPELRELVDRCTAGRRDTLSSVVVRRQSKLVLSNSEGGGEGDVVRVLQAAKEWWTAEVKVAEDFLLMREEKKARGEWDENYYKRPSLREVKECLEGLRARIGDD
ncbi:ribosomal protein S6 kinase alpha-5 [Podospora conica]|nr:ribosomal protein S6 kinase alpha-5 [Schizothecium conicum]